jgi:hypothetical protein
MMYDSVSEQEPRWPEVEQKQVLQVVEESCQQLAWPQKKRAGRPAKVSWSHLCIGILLCFVRGWNTQLEVWRLIGSERLGGFAPVKVCDQAIYNRIERAGTSLQWVFEQVSAWLRTRQHGWDIELAFRVLKDHLDLHHLWSAKYSVVQVQLWCCLILAQVYHALQVEAGLGFVQKSIRGV